MQIRVGPSVVLSNMEDDFWVYPQNVHYSWPDNDALKSTMDELSGGYLLSSPPSHRGETIYTALCVVDEI